MTNIIKVYEFRLTHYDMMEANEMQPLRHVQKLNHVTIFFIHEIYQLETRLFPFYEKINV